MHCGNLLSSTKTNPKKNPAGSCFPGRSMQLSTCLRSPQKLNSTVRPFLAPPQISLQGALSGTSCTSGQGLLEALIIPHSYPTLMPRKKGGGSSDAAEPLLVPAAQVTHGSSAKSA